MPMRSKSIKKISELYVVDSFISSEICYFKHHDAFIKIIAYQQLNFLPLDQIIQLFIKITLKV